MKIGPKMKSRAVTGLKLQIFQSKMAANWPIFKINKPKTIGFLNYPGNMYILTNSDENWTKSVER